MGENLFLGQVDRRREVRRGGARTPIKNYWRGEGAAGPTSSVRPRGHSGPTPRACDAAATAS